MSKPLIFSRHEHGLMSALCGQLFLVPHEGRKKMNIINVNEDKILQTQRVIIFAWLVSHWEVRTLIASCQRGHDMTCQLYYLQKTTTKQKRAKRRIEATIIYIIFLRRMSTKIVINLSFGSQEGGKVEVIFAI